VVSQSYIIFVVHLPFRVSSFFLSLHFGAFGMLRVGDGQPIDFVTFGGRAIRERSFGEEWT
jgi:hypothetical protein